MTAHRSKPTITTQRIEWFARYYLSNPSWGIFHVSLADGNYKLGAALLSPEGFGRAYWSEELQDVARWFDRLTPSQRARLGTKAKAKAKEIETDEDDVPWRRRQPYSPFPHR